MMSVLFAFELEEAKRELQPHGLEPLAITPHQCVMALAWFDYAESDLGPYRELSLSIPARRLGDARRAQWLRWVAGDRGLGAWVLHLPVTSELACREGRSRLGLPKTVERIDFEASGRRFRGRLFASEAPLLELEVSLPRAAGTPIGSLPLLSELNGQLIRTPVSTHGSVRWSPLPRVSLRLTAPHHPIARTLAATGPALAALWASEFSAEILAPEQLAL